MSEALKELMIQNTAEINAQIKRLERFKKILMSGDPMYLSGDQLVKSENEAAEIDKLINQLKYNLNHHVSFDIDHLKREERDAGRSKRLAFKIPKVEV